MRFHTFAIASLAATVGLGAMTADAVTLRWAGRGDMQTTDPHSQNENLTNNINGQIYEFLVLRNKQLKQVPGLAESWTQVNPTTWRFKLRPGVKFHDGAAFTADDAVFSIERASSSAMRDQSAGVRARSMRRASRAASAAMARDRRSRRSAAMTLEGIVNFTVRAYDAAVRRHAPLYRR